MADQSWLLNTTGKASAGTLDGDEEIRVVDDPAEQTDETPVADRPGYIADDETYLQGVLAAWKADNPSGDVQQCMADALASWSREPRPLSPEAEKARLGVYAVNKRYAVMCSGITVNGVSIPGDDVSQQRLKAARDLLVAGAITEPITIVIGLAAWTATASDLTTIINAIATKTQAAFATQGVVVVGIVNGSITTTEQIDAADWPT